MQYLIIGSSKYPIPKDFIGGYMIGVFNDKDFNRKNLLKSKLEELYLVDIYEENDMEIVSFPVEMVQSVYAHTCFHSITEDCPDNIIKEIKDGTKVKKNIFDKRLL